MRKVSASGFIAESPAKLQTHSAILLGCMRARRISPRPLQCARILGGDRRDWPRAALFLHSRSAGRRGMAGFPQRARQRRDGGAARGDPCRPARLSAPPAYAPCGESPDGRRSPGLTAGKRLKVVLYNPWAVFYTMPLALLAIGSELDPERLRSRDHRCAHRFRRRERRALAYRRGGMSRRDRAHRRADLGRACAYRARPSGPVRICPWYGAAGIPPCSPANV